MRGNLEETITSCSNLITIQAGKRLRREDAANGDLNFTIEGQGRPGFFLIFGLLLGGFPLLCLMAIVFGTPGPDNESSSGIFPTLFLIPFAATGTATFLIGLFLWLGKTTIELGKQAVIIQRQLFGKTFQRKIFDRSTLNLSFIQSHTSNDVPVYKLSFNDAQPKNKIGVGGSLEAAELHWLEHEIGEALGQETEEYPKNRDSIYGAIADPNYRSKTLSFTQTPNGWTAQSRSSILGAVGHILFGSIPLIVGLMMADVTRTALLELIPSVKDAFENLMSQSSSGSTPIWCAFIFGGGGGLMILGAIFQLAYRVRISQRHARISIQRRWLFFSVNSVHDSQNFTHLEVNKIVTLNDVPRCRLRVHLKNGQKAVLFRFATRADVGQLYARLSDMIPDRAQ